MGDSGGIPAMRYQNETTGVIEVEGRWTLLPKWGLIGFIGRGEIDDDNPAFDTALDEIPLDGVKTGDTVKVHEDDTVEIRTPH
jgi:hypothetical protein